VLPILPGLLRRGPGLGAVILLVFIGSVLLNINNAITGLLKGFGAEMVDKLPSSLYVRLVRRQGMGIELDSPPEM
jgi:hypothetical protein